MTPERPAPVETNPPPHVAMLQNPTPGSAYVVDVHRPHGPIGTSTLCGRSEPELERALADMENRAAQWKTIALGMFGSMICAAVPMIIAYDRCKNGH